MKRRDEGKTSLVDFLRSIKIAQRNNTLWGNECPTRFAHFKQSVQAPQQPSTEDSQLIRSAN